MCDFPGIGMWYGMWVKVSIGWVVRGDGTSWVVFLWRGGLCGQELKGEEVVRVTGVWQ
jgi:hypothetical protein